MKGLLLIFSLFATISLPFSSSSTEGADLKPEKEETRIVIVSDNGFYSVGWYDVNDGADCTIYVYDSGHTVGYGDDC
ncbi:hypothetical protein [Phaeodactylibacter luteus]|uniref:Uncharacterized protein n=1 Tax=Phaeodactylibacter luteus TaxID=1564516 RepID=A0A5C6RKI3_9BACT|nr:hypothetical protein [Phaeodactylibacter luteus]TXB62921.1 hypothetical protein FRY97_11295 [Phaeodactylibacter luteus]